MSSLESAIHDRISALFFDPARTLSRAEIRSLVEDASHAPSSFNIQHWRFIAVQDPNRLADLTGAAYGQTKVRDAAVTFIVLADLDAHAMLPAILDRSVDAGAVPRDIADGWLPMAAGMYDTNTELRRDEAIRSASMAAMILMLSAHAKGLVSGPMIGFDVDAVRRLFHIADRYVPVMLLPVGYGSQGNVGRKPRLGTDQILRFDDAGDLDPAPKP